MTTSGSWRQVRIRDVGRVVTGRTPSSAVDGCFGDEYLFITPTDMDGRKTIRTTDRRLSKKGAQLLERCRVPAGSVAVSCIGWQMGKVVIAGAEAFTNQQLNTIIPNAAVDLHFLYYTLSTRSQELKTLGAVGTRTPILNKSAFEKLEIVIPPLPTQRKIASILSAYDELIENNTRRIAILEEMAQSLYREWFVHYRYPGHEHVPLVASPLGPVPQGWEVRKLGDVVELAYGKALKASDRQEGPYPVYGSSGVVGHHDTHLVEGPGVVVGRKGNVGSVFLSADDFYPIDTVFYVRSKLPLLYVFYALREITFINSDVAVPGLNRSQAYLTPFLVPGGCLLSAFVEIVAPMLDEARVLERKSANLRSTRDLLLPKLIAGEVEPGSDSTPWELELIHSGTGTHSDVVGRSVAVGHPD